MEPLKLAARAKINLTLDVLYRRKDGYHEVETIMQQIDLADYLYFEPVRGGNIQLSCSDPAVPAGSENLVYKAAKFLAPPVKKCGVNIYIKKNIPVGAGLAGGSADAAAALVALNFLWKRGFSFQELMEIGANLGADVPFCLVGGTALARGKGSKLQILPSIPPFHVILAKVPGLSISTAAVYQSLKVDEITRRPSTEKIVKAVQQGDRRGISNYMVNVLEEVVIPRYPEVARLKDTFRQRNLEPVMSGSGPTVFALCEDEVMAREAVNFLRIKGYEAWLCRTCNIKAEFEGGEKNEG